MWLRRGSARSWLQGHTFSNQLCMKSMKREGEETSCSDDNYNCLNWRTWQRVLTRTSTGHAPSDLTEELGIRCEQQALLRRFLALSSLFFFFSLFNHAAQRTFYSLSVGDVFSSAVHEWKGKPQSRRAPLIWDKDPLYGGGASLNAERERAERRCEGGESVGSNRGGTQAAPSLYQELPDRRCPLSTTAVTLLWKS